MASKKTNEPGDSSKKKPKKPLSLTNQEEPLLPKLEQLNIESLVAQAIFRFKEEDLADKKTKYKEISHLANIMEEYLSCFITLGFSIQGEKICIFTAPTSKDEGAIVDLLRSTFFDISNNRP